MRKKIMKAAFVAVFAAVAGYGVYMNQRTEAMSDLMLANVEALASGESSGGSCEEVCYPCTNWQCTRILGGVTSVCTQYRKNK